MKIFFVNWDITQPSDNYIIGFFIYFIEYLLPIFELFTFKTTDYIINTLYLRSSDTLIQKSILKKICYNIMKKI